MAKYFLGSVGKAEAFRVDENGNLQLAFVSNTLTDSGLNIQTTKEDIRAGQGAPIQFSFYHDPSVEITLTDVLWKPEYLTAQLGANFDGDHVGYVTKEVTFTAGEATLDEDVLPLPIACSDEDQLVVWGAKAGKDDWKKIAYEGNATHKLTLAGAEGKYCVRYLAADARANVAEISTQIIPEELFLLITAPIFAGDACAASKGKAAGTITFEVPRFQLNGAQEFQMNMSSNQTMSLSGIALASESAECDAVGGKLLRIIEVITNRDWRDEISDIMSDEEYEIAESIPHVYGVKKDGTVTPIENADLTFTPVLTDGAFTAATETNGQKIELKKGTEVIAETNVTIAAKE